MPPFLFHKRQPKNAIQDTNISANCAIEHLIMAENLPSAAEQELLGIKHLLWGPNVKAEIFKRWSQGFYFSTSEKSALEQMEGGPCSIIAPIQAFIIKILLSEYNGFGFREAMTDDIQNTTLVKALCEVLQQCEVQKYYLVELNPEIPSAVPGVVNGDATDEPPPTDSRTNVTVVDPAAVHNQMKTRVVSNIKEVENYYMEHISNLKAQYGILLFLYSVIASKGLERVRHECDTSEPLIDETYGYGSQSLINLMITGKAVTYVWDNEQDVGGLKLKGLEKQSQIGFITLMEHLRYCTVGCFYKNPVHPIWVLGSETHLTVLFSDEKKLVSTESKSEQARRVFKSFDKDGNNFISSDSLQDVLKALDLVADEKYVDIMRNKLDPENLGIILMYAFMEEFFPRDDSSNVDMFTLYHYNGLAQSNCYGQVQYQVGSAILLESDLKSICDSNPMLTCLQTKWPNIEVNWCYNVTPSLN